MNYYRLQNSVGGEQLSWLTICGDFVLPYLDEAAVGRGAMERLYEEGLLELIGSSAFAAVNVEAVITEREERIKKMGPVISSKPAAARAIRKGGFGAGILANNHILDRGPRGIEDTIRACNEAGVATVGAGQNAAEAEKSLTVMIDNKRVALLAYTEEDFACATEHSAGAAKYDPARAAEAIRRAKAGADIVIVSVHGGREYCPTVSPRLRQWYRSLVDDGADAVIGHHQHVVQGVELYREAPIVYSIGHFLFDWRAHRPQCWFEGTVCRVGIAGGKVRAVEIAGVEQVRGEDVRNVLMGEEKQQWLSRRMIRLNEIVRDDELMEQFWQCFCAIKRAAYINLIQRTSLHIDYSFGEICQMAARERRPGMLASWLGERIWRALQQKSTREENLLRLKNLLMCPSALELVTTILDMEIKKPSIDEHIRTEFESLMEYCRF